MNQIHSVIEILRSLPPDTPLSYGILAAILEAMVQPARPKPKNAISEMDDNATIGTKELAALLGRSTSTIEKWRRETDKGPRYQPGGKAKYRVADVKDWMDRHTVANTSEATVKGLSHFILEDSTAFTVFSYADGSLLGLQAAIQYEEDHPETFCESFAVVNMGDAWQNHKGLYEGLLNESESAIKTLSEGSVAKNFDVAYWLFVQFIGGKLDNYQPLLKAIRLLVNHGTDINAQNNMTGYNLAHVLAINETGFVNDNDFFNFMNYMLDMGMNVDLMNHENISGKHIAEVNDTESYSSNFLKVLNKRDFASSLEFMLKKK